MRIQMNMDEIRRPLGSQFAGDPEAERFFNRVGLVSFWGRGDKPIDFAALNRRLDENDRQFLKYLESLGREDAP